MSFISLSYVLFLPAAFIIFHLLKGRHRLYFLFAASLFFYGSWNPYFLPLLLFVIGVSYGAGAIMFRITGWRKAFVGLSVFLTLLPLAAFKYFNFVNREAGFLVLGEDGGLFDMYFLLPVGISFFTFQAISYILDIYDRRRDPIHDVTTYGLYICFFPQLVAGPIERSTTLLPQLDNLFNKPHRDHPELISQNIVTGLRLILLGFFKKMVLADNLAMVVDAIYGSPEEFGGATLMAATYCFAFQIYFDFSAYTDIARGSARLFGVELMENFRLPYMASSIGDFWRRWHISLSTWFRDYVYFRLGGSRENRVIIARNAMTVFVLSGIWHGANWTFIIWGAIHGAVWIAERAARPLTDRFWGLLPDKMIFALARKALAVLFTFHVVVLAWIFFRAESLGQASYILRRIITDPLGGIADYSQFSIFYNSGFAAILALIAAVEMFRFASKFSLARTAWFSTSTWARLGVYAFAIGAIWILAPFGTGQFIYFRF